MLAYAVGGALVGIVIGHVFPPGSLFWFAVGTVSGCLAQKYLSKRRF